MEIFPTFKISPELLHQGCHSSQLAYIDLLLNKQPSPTPICSTIFRQAASLQTLLSGPGLPGLSTNEHCRPSSNRHPIPIPSATAAAVLCDLFRILELPKVCHPDRSATASEANRCTEWRDLGLSGQHSQVLLLGGLRGTSLQLLWFKISTLLRIHASPGPTRFCPRLRYPFPRSPQQFSAPLWFKILTFLRFTPARSPTSPPATPFPDF